MRGNRGFRLGERGRVPFALVAVVLLVGAVGVTVTLSTRQPSSVDRDPSLVLERSKAGIQTALRDASLEGTIEAARYPVLAAANTPYGRTLTPTGVAPGAADTDTVFERYVKLRVYLAAHERLDGLEQRIDNTTATVSLPAVETPGDARNAIDRVTLGVGGDGLPYGTPSEDLGHGNVRVTLEDIELRVRDDGEGVATRTMDVNVTVATPVFDLHNRTEEYERQLNADFGNASAYRGLGDYVGARAYPFAWARGYAQSRGEPVPNVLSERHVEVLANEGVYAAQDVVFGSPDRFDDRSLTRAWGATLAQDNRRMYGSPTGTSTSVGAVADRVAEPGFVAGSNYTYRDVSGDLTDAPDWTELASQNDHLNETHTVNLTNAAESAFGEMETSGGIDAAIDRTYEIDVGTDADVAKTVSVGPHTDIEALVSRTVSVENVERVLDTTENDGIHEYYRIHLVFSAQYERDGEPSGSNVVYDTTITVNGEHGPATIVAERGVEYEYETGPVGAGDAFFDTNFVYDAGREEVPKRAVEEAIAGVDDFERAEEQLEAHISDATNESDGSIDADSVLDRDDLVDIVTEDDPTVAAAPVDRAALRGWIAADLNGLVAETGTVSAPVERHELLAGRSPFRRLERRINDSAANATYVYRGTDSPYLNAPQKALAEARMAYMERLRDRVNATVLEHEATMARLDGEIEAHTGSGLDNATAFARRQFARDPDPETYLRNSALLGDVAKAPNAAPNYMTFGRVDLDAVSATGTPPEGFVPLAGESESVYASPYDRSAVALRVAGGVLEAGNRTDALASDPSWDDGHLRDLERALNDDIDRIVDRAASEGAAPFPAIVAPDLEPAIRDEVERLGPVERQAIRLGSGRRTLDRIARNVSEDADYDVVSEYSYLHPAFEAHLHSAVRYGLREAVERERVGTDTATAAGALGSEIRAALDARTATVIEERLTQADSGSLTDTATTATAADWLAGRTGDSAVGDVDATALAPNRNPSGLYVPGEPGWNELTANLWHVTVTGEYARFTVQASVGTTAGPDAMRYVRQDADVSVPIAGSDRRLGRNRKLTFESNTSVLVAVPDERLGVGDRAGPARDCSPSYDTVGPVSSPAAFGGC